MTTKLTLQTVTIYISKIKYKLLIIFLILNSTLNFAQTCNANLEVLKNRNTRSTSFTGTYYKMTIINNGPNDVYTLSSFNTNTIYTNSDGSNTSTNVALNISFEDNNFNPISSIEVKSGETITFLTHITIPFGTPIDKWCCTQINASSNLCEGYNLNTTLHTLVINSNDD